MKLVNPSDPHLVAIEEHVNGQMAGMRPVLGNAHGRANVQNMLHAAAQQICPERRLSFTVTQHQVLRMAVVQCYEIEPHMSRENPYQSQESIKFYDWMLRGLVGAKLELFLGPYYRPTTNRLTRNESLLRNALQNRHSQHRLNGHNSRT